MRKEQDPSRVYARIDPILGKKLRLAATLLDLSMGEIIEQAVGAWLDSLEIKDVINQSVARVSAAAEKAPAKQTKAR